MVRRPIGKDERELVAADPRRGSRVPHRLAKALADRPEDLVAEGVSVGVVHDLEVVEVQDHERERPAPPPRSIDLLLEHLAKAAMVCEAGQRVALGQSLKLLLVTAEQGQQAGGEHDPDRAHRDYGEVVRRLAERDHAQPQRPEPEGSRQHDPPTRLPRDSIGCSLPQFAHAGPSTG